MKYIVHIFDVDDNACIIHESMQVHEIECNSDDEALTQGEKLRQLRNDKTPLPAHPELGRIEYLCNVWSTDEFGYVFEMVDWQFPETFLNEIEF